MPDEGLTPEDLEANPGDAEATGDPAATATATPDHLEGHEGDPEAIGDPGPSEDEPSDVLYYTPEEMATLDPSEADRRRIPPEHRAFHDQAMKGVSKKINALAEKEKQLETSRNAPPPPQPGQESVFQTYMRDPVGFIREVNSRIHSAERSGDTEGAADLRNLKEDLSLQEKDYNRRSSHASEAQRETDTTLAGKIPGYYDKRAKLKAFAVEQGVPERAYDALVNGASVHPEVAVAATMIINGFYDLKHAGAKIPTKRKNVPLKGGTAPRQGAPVASATDTKELARLTTKANETQSEEDWAEVMKLKTRIARTPKKRK
jgi:hypothetical protein